MGNGPRKFLAAKAARKTHPFLRSDSPEYISDGQKSEGGHRNEGTTSSSGSESEGVVGQQFGVKSGKTRQRSAVVSFQNGEEEDETVEEASRRKREIIIISSDSESSDSPEEEDISGLLAALGEATLPARLHLEGVLPFLVRNVRQRFPAYCRSIGIKTQPVTTPTTPFRVKYRYRLHPDDDWNERLGSSSQWRCPLCDIPGLLATREMLAYHVNHDHSEVRSTWTDKVGQC